VLGCRPHSSLYAEFLNCLLNKLCCAVPAHSHRRASSLTIFQSKATLNVSCSSCRPCFDDAFPVLLWFFQFCHLLARNGSYNFSCSFTWDPTKPCWLQKLDSGFQKIDSVSEEPIVDNRNLDSLNGFSLSRSSRFGSGINPRLLSSQSVRMPQLFVLPRRALPAAS
jgi:hypothetical protein